MIKQEIFYRKKCMCYLNQEFCEEYTNEESFEDFVNRVTDFCNNNQRFILSISYLNKDICIIAYKCKK